MPVRGAPGFGLKPKRGFAPSAVNVPFTGGLIAGSLTDNFDDNARDPAKWTEDQFYNHNGASVTTGMTVAETGQRLEITPPAAAVVNTFSGYVSVDRFELSGSSVWVKMTLASGTDLTGTAAGQHAALVFGDSDANNYRFRLVGAEILISRFSGAKDQ